MLAALFILDRRAVSFNPWRRTRWAARLAFALSSASRHDKSSYCFAKKIVKPLHFRASAARKTGNRLRYPIQRLAPPKKAVMLSTDG